jgi:hypothetical protein
MTATATSDNRRELPPFPWNERDLDRFREVQQLAYRCAEDLAGCRESILAEVRSGLPPADIYRAVDERITRDGYENRHQVYPGRVIGHQVTRLRSRLPSEVNLFGFGVRTLQTLGRELIARPRGCGRWSRTSPSATPAPSSRSCWW